MFRNMCVLGLGSGWLVSNKQKEMIASIYKMLFGSCKYGERFAQYNIIVGLSLYSFCEISCWDV